MVQHVDLDAVDPNAAGPRPVGSNPVTKLDQAIAALGLVPSKMVGPLTAPAPAAAPGNVPIQKAG